MRSVGSLSLAPAVVVVLGMLVADTGLAQTRQNPSPMSDRTRPHPRLVETRAPGRRVALPLGELYLSPRAEARSRRGTLPLVVHLHGTPWVVEHQVARGAPHAALVSVNLGSGSARYAAPFQDAAAFASLLDAAANAVQTVTGRRVAWSSITLTSFSAGYGAVRAILSHPDDATRIHAVVLLDSLHASYLIDGDPSAPRSQDPAVKVDDLAVFVDLARRAVRSEVQFRVTHSEVYPGTYASTTDTANALLDALGLHRRPVLRHGPLGMQQLSEGGRGGFRVLGFAGNSAPDHVDHLHALGPWLADWKLAR